MELMKPSKGTFYTKYTVSGVATHNYALGYHTTILKTPLDMRKNKTGDVVLQKFVHE